MSRFPGGKYSFKVAFNVWERMRVIWICNFRANLNQIALLKMGTVWTKGFFSKV